MFIRHILFILSILFIVTAFYTGHWCFEHHTSKALWTINSNLTSEEINSIVKKANNLKLPAFLLGAFGAIGIVLFFPNKLSPSNLPILGLKLPKYIEIPAKIIAFIAIIIFGSAIIFCIVGWFLHIR